MAADDRINLSLARLNRWMELLMALVAWLLVAIGTATLLVTVPMIYFIATGEMRPGEPYFLDGLAPQRHQLVSAAGIGFMSLIVGVALRLTPSRSSGRETQ